MDRSTDEPLAHVLTERERHALATVWQSPPGPIRWFSHVNHKSIGWRYMVTAFVFFLIGGIEALVMRAQLSAAEADLVSPETFNTLFTMHGTTMMFLFAVPMLEGLGMYLVPLMIGTRDMAFPRLNAFGYYVYLIGGVALYIAFFFGVGPDAGWFNYVPLSGPEFSPGYRIDVWLTLITFIEVAALTAAVELIVTILKQRAPGMTLPRMPLFVWAMLIMAIMIVFAMPAVIVASLTLALDRLVGTHFYTAAMGGDALLWQHLFWFFGHPDVYIMFIPALGIISSIITVFCRRIFGYRVLVLSLVATGFISFGLWVHHMFVSGLPRMGENFFSAASMIIAIPTGVQIFCWIATIWMSRPRLATPMLFVIGFIVIFVAGGLTGVVVASVPFDAQVHDTYFIVAHFHYVLIGGVVFPIFAALYFWLPKITGRTLSETIGRWVFGLAFVGFNVAFFPMHQLGLDGMPRRIYTYLPGLGWERLNILATVGAALLALGVLLLVADIARAFTERATATANPWQGDTLEWLAPSPPPAYNFAAVPMVSSRHPLWSDDGTVHVSRGLLTNEREILVTTLMDAEPDHTMLLPGPSYWPILMALAAAGGFIGVMFTPWAVVLAIALTFLCLVGWFWPRDTESQLRWEKQA